MAQTTSGIKSVLSFSAVYDLFQNLVGASRCRAEFIASYVRARSGDRVLDIGCGTGDILEHLPRVDYYGFDLSEEYIEAAKRRYGNRANFSCENVSLKTLEGLPDFDIVLAVGVLHHLDDQEAVALFNLAKTALKPGARLVTLDPCYAEGQSKIARLIISLDRGQNVRDRNGYERLGKLVFRHVRSNVRDDLLNMPYTHIILECRG